MTTRERLPNRREAGAYDAADDFAKSIEVAYAAVRARVAAGGAPWVPKLRFDVPMRTVIKRQGCAVNPAGEVPPS